MADYWVKRQAHRRLLKSGHSIYVSSNWALYEHDNAGQKKKKRPRQRACPECGTSIISKRMPNGGWAHFESGPGLSRSKHPCLNRGEGMSKKRDSVTLDLFRDERRDYLCRCKPKCNLGFLGQWITDRK